MLTSREVATLIILATALLIVLVVPKFRAHMAPSTAALVRAAVAPRLVWIYLIVVFVVVASTALAWLIGLWEASLRTGSFERRSR